jgi:hypothetical protein
MIPDVKDFGANKYAEFTAVFAHLEPTNYLMTDVTTQGLGQNI